MFHDNLNRGLCCGSSYIIVECSKCLLQQHKNHHIYAHSMYSTSILLSTIIIIWGRRVSRLAAYSDRCHIKISICKIIIVKCKHWYSKHLVSEKEAANFSAVLQKESNIQGFWEYTNRDQKKKRMLSVSLNLNSAMLFWHNLKSLINYSNYLRSNILTDPSAPTEANMSLPPPARLNAMSYTCNVHKQNYVLHENVTANTLLK